MKKTVLFSAGLLIWPFLMHASITPGNGVIVDSAATDYYNHTQGSTLPSLYQDIATHSPANIQYVFPDIGYITLLESTDIANGKAVNAATTIQVMPENTDPTQSCNPLPTLPTTANNTIEFIYSFCARPSIPRPWLLPKDEGYVFPPFQTPDLGANVTLSDIITYYKSISSIESTQVYVVPMMTYDPGWSDIIQALNNKGNPNLQTNLNTLASEIADTISATKANGVAFDNEPAISKVDGDQTSTGMEYGFFNIIAQKFVASNQNLFLFDATTTAAYLDVTASNVVVLYGLYDFGTENKSSAYGPYPLSTYDSSALNQTDVYHTAENALTLPDSVTSGTPPASVPFMYVLPASATQTIWDSMQVYNTGGTTPSNLVISGSTSTGNCPANPDLVETNVLSIFLCGSTKNSCPGPANTNNIQQYLGSNNCIAYTNTVNAISPPKSNMDSYFNQALAAITAAKNGPNSVYFGQNYKGSVLYTWRIPSYPDMTCAGHYYSQFNTNTPSQCIQVLPANISNDIWSGFANWTP